MNRYRDQIYSTCADIIDRLIKYKNTTREFFRVWVSDEISIIVIYPAF